MDIALLIIVFLAGFLIGSEVVMQTVVRRMMKTIDEVIELFEDLRDCDCEHDHVEDPVRVDDEIKNI